MTRDQRVSADSVLRRAGSSCPRRSMIPKPLIALSGFAALVSGLFPPTPAAAPEVDRPSPFGRAFVGASAGWAAGAAIGWGFAHARDTEQYGMIPPIVIGGAVGSGIGANLRNEGRGSWPANILATAVSIPIMIIPPMAICWETCEGLQVAAISAGYAATQIPSAAVAEWGVDRFLER